ncbi:MAG TPA: DUF4232 domain-containing protein [Actinoplanes sp.]
MTLVAMSIFGLAACSSGAASSAPASSGPSSSSSVPTGQPTTATTTPAGRAVATASTRSSTTNCAESQLRATIDPRHIPGNGTLDANGATKKGVLVDFENTSKTTCRLIGYPGAATVNAAGRQITQATRTLRGDLDGLPKGSNKIPAVSLAPGHYAAAMIEGVDTRKQGAAQAGCADTFPRILVTPPNTRIAVPFTVSWPACFSFDIHPVMALPSTP